MGHMDAKLDRRYKGCVWYNIFSPEGFFISILKLIRVLFVWSLMDMTKDMKMYFVEKQIEKIVA